MLSITAHTEQTHTELTELRAEIERLTTENLRLRTEDVAADDLRVRHIWVEAARVAQQADYCREYDRIAELVGGIDRDTLREEGDLDEPYLVTTHITLDISLTISAYDENNAIDKIHALSESELCSLASERGFDLSDFNIEGWEAQDAEPDN